MFFDQLYYCLFLLSLYGQGFGTAIRNQKVQRPIKGYTLVEYISKMFSINKQYKGKFIFEVTIIKGYNA